MAGDLDIPERTLRRAVSEGLVHGKRISPKKIVATVAEEEYLRRFWPLLKQIRAALRTEPNVRLAVLFGSQAVGNPHSGSDIDLFVSLRESSMHSVIRLAQRLESHLGRDVQIVRLEDGFASLDLLDSIVRDGRVLIDRDRMWGDVREDAKRRLEGHVSKLDSVDLDDLAASIR